MTDKLKPCPFCWGEAFEYYSGSQFEFCEVVCKECGCRSKRKTEEEAIEAWNTRKPMDRIIEQLEERRKLNIEMWESSNWMPNKTMYGNLAKGYEEAIAIVKGVQNE